MDIFTIMECHTVNLDIMYSHKMVCFFYVAIHEFFFYSQFLNVGTNLYNIVLYVQAIQIRHFWQLLINVFLVRLLKHLVWSSCGMNEFS